ncbi:MAG: hypothetical protein ACI9TH_001175 [Kiritimatiellia bacterium]|jgi:hypothetical protein
MRKRLLVCFGAASIISSIGALAVYYPGQYDLNLGVIGINKVSTWGR